MTLRAGDPEGRRPRGLRARTGPRAAQKDRKRHRKPGGGTESQEGHKGLIQLNYFYASETVLVSIQETYFRLKANSSTCGSWLCSVDLDQQCG